jgi:membrane protein YdbS with pleckstrin-like domain
MTTVQEYPLEKRKITKKLTVAMLFWMLLFIPMYLIAAFVVDEYWGFAKYLVLALFGLVFIIEYWYQNAYYNSYFYDVEKDFLNIRKGVIMPRQTMLPWEKLQDVYMDQDIFDRIFDLWDVHVSTATEVSGYHAHIDGLSQDNAEAIRNLILEKTRKR